MSKKMVLDEIQNVRKSTQRSRSSVSNIAVSLPLAKRIQKILKQKEKKKKAKMSDVTNGDKQPDANPSVTSPGTPQPESETSLGNPQSEKGISLGNPQSDFCSTSPGMPQPDPPCILDQPSGPDQPSSNEMQTVTYDTPCVLSLASPQEFTNIKPRSTSPLTDVLHSEIKSVSDPQHQRESELTRDRGRKYKRSKRRCSMYLPGPITSEYKPDADERVASQSPATCSSTAEVSAKQPAAAGQPIAIDQPTHHLSTHDRHGKDTSSTAVALLMPREVSPPSCAESTSETNLAETESMAHLMDEVEDPAILEFLGERGSPKPKARKKHMRNRRRSADYMVITENTTLSPLESADVIQAQLPMTRRARRQKRMSLELFRQSTETATQSQPVVTDTHIVGDDMQSSASRVEGTETQNDVVDVANAITNLPSSEEEPSIPDAESDEKIPQEVSKVPTDVLTMCIDDTTKPLAAESSVYEEETNQVTVSPVKPHTPDNTGDTSAEATPSPGPGESPRRSTRKRYSSQSQTPKTVAKRKFAKRKPPENIEDIYLNRLWRTQMPKEKTWETIYEQPKQKKSGEELLFSAQRKKCMMIFDEYYHLNDSGRLQQRRKKAVKMGWKAKKKMPCGQEDEIDRLLKLRIAQWESEENPDCQQVADTKHTQQVEPPAPVWPVRSKVKVPELWDSFSDQEGSAPERECKPIKLLNLFKQSSKPSSSKIQSKLQPLELPFKTKSSKTSSKLTKPSTDTAEEEEEFYTPVNLVPSVNDQTEHQTLRDSLGMSPTF